MKSTAYLLALTITLGLSTSVNAYEPLPLSPSWLKTTYTAMQIANSPVFRGKVLMVNGQNSLLVEREDGSQMTVRLFHTHTTNNETHKQMLLQKSALTKFVGFDWYIRGDQSKNFIDGIFLTKDGVNANMLMVYAGIYDLNTRSIIYSHDKTTMENKYKYMKSHNLNPN